MSEGVKQMITASIFFSLMNLLVKFVPHIPALELVFFRCLISLIITLYLLRKAKVSIFGNNKKVLILRGVFGITALTMFFITLQNMPMASAVTIQYLSPLFTSLFGITLLSEKVKSSQWLFFAISFVGVIVVKGFDSNISLLMFCFGLGGAIFSGLAYNCIRMLKSTDHPYVVVLYFPLIGLPITGVYSAMNWVMPTGYDWLYILGIGVFTQIAQIRMTKALQSERIAKVSSVRYLGLFYALFFGFVFFGETYSWQSIIGMLLVILGVVFSLLTKKRKKSIG
ncbi:MAG: drug/metabolite transporter (DMT)-like permease [Flavobacteriales bacterium]|jgi:drug/metabolite transporter (DMT)-like permease